MKYKVVCIQTGEIYLIGSYADCVKKIAEEKAQSDYKVFKIRAA